MSPQFIPPSLKVEVIFGEDCTFTQSEKKNQHFFTTIKPLTFYINKILLALEKAEAFSQPKSNGTVKIQPSLASFFLVQTRHLQVTSTKTHKGKLAKHSPKWKVNNVTTYCIGGRQLCTQAKQTRELVKVDLDTIFTSPTTCVTPSDSLLTVLTP